MKEKNYFIGIDVGSKSVRAALVSECGQIQAIHVASITIYNEKADFYEQDSDEIWKAVCVSVQNVTKNIEKRLVKGIGFDATCSLVVLDRNFGPISVSPDQKDDHKNVIMWMDHRAKAEADLLNTKNYKFLEYVGGKVFLEMQMPKLMWLQRHLPDCWSKAGHFMGLPDFLTFKATGIPSRSLCSLVCKWAYVNDGVNQGWEEEFLRDMGLEDLTDNDYSKLGQKILSPGEKVGGLSAESALELGLLENTSVGTSLIDAHAGILALLFAHHEGEEKVSEVSGRLGLISGTSTCHMGLSREPRFVKGVWGPFLSAIIPQLWVYEGGQSATGSLVDHIVLNHPATKSCPEDRNVYEWVEEILLRMTKSSKEFDASVLTREIHVYPDFHGNRAPLADSTFKGMVCGVTLDKSEENLALMYLATLQGLAYGTKAIVEQLEKSGHEIKTILMCGGLSNSRTFIQIHADVLGLPVLIPHAKESVLLGAAMLGAHASGVFAEKRDLSSVAKEMAGKSDAFYPRKELERFHQLKYKVFKKMQEDQMQYRKLMEIY